MKIILQFLFGKGFNFRENKEQYNPKIHLVFSMYDAKTFADLKGIFSWMEERKRLTEQEHNENIKKKGFGKFKEEDDDDNLDPKSTIRRLLTMTGVQISGEVNLNLWRELFVLTFKKE